ncbi:MAG: tandem-95 repeat protein, partial [Chloroflexota bacterium]|nr:tandem-95 repeat protein [Chloroflexota bacterium]
MRNPLGPSIVASPRVVFEALASTVEVESPSERLFPRYARYHALLSRLPRRLQHSCSRGRRSLKLSTWRDGLLVMLLVLATPLAYAQFPPEPPLPPPPVPTPPVNVPPVANDDSDETPFNTLVVIDVVANDTDADGDLDPASVAIGADPTNGTAVPNGSGAVTYTPAAGFSGPDSFTYTVKDTLGATSNVATVTVTVINQAPVANNDTGETPFETARDINVVANDTDADGNLDPTTVAIDSGPTNGTAVPNGSGIVTYTPAAAFFGPDSFTYTVKDTQGATSNVATVTVAVIPPADLELSLTDTPDPLTVDGQLTYTITVRNNGPGTATGVLVEDSLPPEAALAGPAFSSQGLCEGVVCNLETLAAGAQATVTINVKPTLAGDLSNAAEVFSDIDPNPVNNSRTAMTTVKEPEPDQAEVAV